MIPYRDGYLAIISPEWAKALGMTTAKDAADEHKDFMEFAGKVIVAGVKLKAAMLKRNLTVAKAKCPMCPNGHLHGRIEGRKNHLRMWCDGCEAQMME